MVKIKVSKPKARGWPFAGIVALVLGIMVLIDKGSLTNSSGLAATGCRVEVTADVLNVRTSPEPNAGTAVTLHKGDLRGAETTVQNGYRKLPDGWALDEFLRPLPGSACTAR